MGLACGAGATDDEEVTIDRSLLCTYDEVQVDFRFEPSEVLEINELWKEAKQFVAAHRWCAAVKAQSLAFAAIPVLCVFLTDIHPLPPATSPLWVIVGDIPPAYINADEATTVAEAIEDYCAAMKAWISAVREDGDLEKLIPVRERGSLVLTKGDGATADSLQRRIAFIEREILPRA